MSYTPTPPSTDSSNHHLAAWLHQTLRYPGARMRCRMQGNTLHLLYEGEPCPDQALLTYHILEQLNKTDLNKRINYSDPIYQVWLYGRLPHQRKPSWTFRINLDQLGHYLHHFTVRGRSSLIAHQSEESSSSPESVLSERAHGIRQSYDAEDSGRTLPIEPVSPNVPTEHAAVEHAATDLSASNHQDHQPQPSSDATGLIARKLSETLNRLGVAVDVRAKTLSRSAPHGSIPSVRVPSINEAATQRLLISCRATYSPSSSLIAEPIARELRSLNLTGIQDAIVSVHVNGEETPDWTLRIDLTPANTLLREWAQWGDIEALTHVLGQALREVSARITTASHKDTTLHLACQPDPTLSTSGSSSALLPLTSSADNLDQSPDVDTQTAEPVFDATSIISIVRPLLEELAPQGVQSAVLYGHLESEDAPHWVEYLTLSSHDDADTVVPPLTLAQQGNLEAIAYLVSRLLNPELDTQLATGGIRVQLLKKNDLLHVMCDAPICPNQDFVTSTVVRLLRQIHGQDIAGVRVYGRRAGLRAPIWNYGTDFENRTHQKIQPEPDFSALDATYVNDLIDASDESPLREDLTSAELLARWSRLRQRVAQRVRRSLLKTQLVALTSDSPALAIPSSIRTHGLKTAAVWAAVGVLSVVQLDWLMSHSARVIAERTDSQRQVFASSPSPELGTTVFPAVEKNSRDGADINNSGSQLSSTASDLSGSSLVSIVPGSSAETLTALEAELLDQSPYPTFNSTQLDLKLALYYQHVAESGPPDVLVIGSSRALRGIDPVILEDALSELGYDNADVFNFGINGATAQVVELVVHRILVPEQLPKLILWADGARAFNGGREDRTYNGISESEGYQLLSQGALDIPIVNADRQVPGTPSSPAPGDWIETFSRSVTTSYGELDDWLSDQLAVLSRAHGNRDTVRALIQDSLTGNVDPASQFASERDELASPENETTHETVAPSNETIRHESVPSRTVGSIASDGFLPLDARFDPVTYYDQYSRVPGNYDRDYANFQLTGQQSDALQSLLQLGNAQDVPIVFINLPLTEEYLDPYRMVYEQEFRQHLLTLDLAYDEFIFRDLSELWLEDEEPSYYRYFSDPSHLNQYGAVEVSKRIAQDPMIPWTGADF
ncbi:MAG: hypothetical protein AAGA75_03500 [Cyanobacteria bacterium P01_E01_bin.6]